MVDIRMARRIAVVGSPGSGKSTMSRVIAARLGLPLIHLDKEHWRPGWVEPPDDEWRAAEEALIARDRSVIDGNYGTGLARKAARADVIVWLDLPTGLCVWRVLKRVVGARGRARARAGGHGAGLSGAAGLVVPALRRDVPTRAAAEDAGAAGGPAGPGHPAPLAARSAGVR